MSGRARVWAVVALAIGVGAAPAVAQDPPAPAAAETDSLPPIQVSPRGAFLRAMAMPGWGHVAIESHTRGGFYFAAEGLTAYTLLRARRRLSDVRERATRRESYLRERLAAQGTTDPTEIDAVLEADAELADMRDLEEARGEQQEDLVALGLFLIFLSGADAYVSTHLSRVPEPLALVAEPSGDGVYDLGVRLTIH